MKEKQPSGRSYRVLAIAATPFFVDRGGHIHIYEQIRALQGLGNQVTLVTYHIGRDLPDVDTRRIPYIAWYQKYDAGPSYRKLVLLPLIFWKSLQVAREIKPDIIHAHGWDAMWAAWWLNKLLGIPFVMDMQGSFSGEIAEHGYARKGSLFYRFLQQIERLSLNQSPVVLSSSSQMCRDATQQFKLKSDHIRVILDGVDTDRFSPDAYPFDPALKARLHLPGKPLLVYMGLLKQYQGVDDLLEAVRVMVHDLNFRDFHLLVIGFPDETHYQTIAAEKGIADYVTFTGKVPYDQTGHYLALADLAVAPKISMTEGDAKIYSYMALGLPVVAYERPASLEILGDLGIYAKYHDPADLARVLRDTLQDTGLRKQRGLQNRQKAVQEYSWQAVAHRIMDAYDRAIQCFEGKSHCGMGKVVNADE